MASQVILPSNSFPSGGANEQYTLNHSDLTEDALTQTITVGTTRNNILILDAFLFVDEEFTFAEAVTSLKINFGKASTYAGTDAILEGKEILRGATGESQVHASTGAIGIGSLAAPDGAGLGFKLTAVGANLSTIEAGKLRVVLRVASRDSLASNSDPIK